MPLEEVVTVRNTTKSQHRLSNSPHISIELGMVGGTRFPQSSRSSRSAKKQTWARRGSSLSVQISIGYVEMQPPFPPLPPPLPIILHVEMAVGRVECVV